MKSDLKTRHGGMILADALVGHGVELAFGVPGESFLPVLDGLHDLKDKLRFVICRQEGGASYMADAWGKLTGEPGVLFVTRGPGATNGAVGVHTAYQDSTCPTNITSGVESWKAVCTPTAPLLAPGPRVTNSTPGLPVSLP